MRRRGSVGTTVLALVAMLALAACGGSSSSSSSSSSGGSGSSGSKTGGSITIAAGTAPQSADNNNDFTTQGNELYSVINTPLLTFKRAAGQAGAEIVPALAESLPTVSNGNKTYTFTLRKGLKYSNGQPIKAGDFKFTIQRALKLSWDASSFLTLHIAGAKDYAGGKAKDISGLTTDDASGKITVNLTAPYGPIVDVLALPGTAPLPQNTPIKPLPAQGTVGDGPYKWGSISPGQSYTLLKNASYNGVPTSSLPPGHADTIVYKVNSNVLANAQAVLSNQADVFDPGDTLPPSILSQIQSQASDRFQPVPLNSTWWFFFGVNQPPFNKLQARQAVMAALDDRALSRLASGFLSPDCHLVPPGIQGSSSPTTCPFGDPNNGPNMAKAKQLMASAGLKGTPVTVWGQERSPRRQWVDYLTSVLNQLGFKAQEKIITSQVYFQVIGNAKTKPQIGFADWNQDFPHPDDFVQLFNSASILPQNSENYGYVRDPHVDSTEAKLNALPATQLSSSAPQWAALDQYMVNQGYYAAFGHLKNPKFYSNRLNFSSGIVSVEYQTDLTSLQLK
jgi:peptide/nickel transport system substrate-binding protein